LNRPSPTSRRATAWLSALLAAHVALVWTLHQRLLFTFGDDASYLILARSLRAFSYRELQFIGEPIAGRFPPGYPAALAAWTWLFGERLGAVALLGMIASASTLIALFLVIRRRWSSELALLVVAVTAVNPTFVTMAGATASEAVFTALTIWALWAADSSDQPGSPSRRAFLAGALAIGAAMTRSAGVTLIGALGLHWLSRRRWGRVATLAVGSALTVGLWLGWTVYAPQRNLRRSYVDDAVYVRTDDGSLVSTFAARIARNVTTYAGQTVASELQLPLTGRTKLDNVVWVGLIWSLGLLGFVSAWRRWRIAALHVATYAGLLAVWAYTIDRFVAPLVPLIIAFVLMGAWMIAEYLTSRKAAYAPVAVAALLAGSALVQTGRLVAQAEECARTRSACSFPRSVDYVDAVLYVDANTPRDARVVTPKSATLYYYTGRQSPYWDEVLALDSTSFRPYLREHGIRYVIASSMFHDYGVLYQQLLGNCEYFDVMRAYSQETFVLAVRDEPRPDGRAAPTCAIVARALKRPPAE
jgi:4-amino-4-deoxy-L-arabinose transferase-like glycosyltransferase